MQQVELPAETPVQSQAERVPHPTSDEQRAGRRRTRPRLWLASAFGLALAGIDAPTLFWVPGAGIDASWLYALHLAFVEHRQWGTEIVWTYGPYGTLAAPFYYTYETWLLAVAVTLAVHLSFFGLVAVFVASQSSRWWHWLILGGVFLLPLAGWPTLELEATVGAMLLLHLANVTRGKTALVAAVAAGLLLALLLTIKGTALTAAVGLLLVAGLVAGRHRARRFLLSLGATVGGFLALWLLAGQSLGGVPAYIRSSYEIVSGYTAAMSLFNEVTEVRFRAAQTLLAAVLMLLTAAGAAIAARRRDRAVLSLSLLALPVLFVNFKEAFTRFGDRGTFFFSMLLVLEALILVQSWTRDVRLYELRVLRPLAGGLIAAVLVGGGLFACGGISSPPVWPLSQVNSHEQDAARTLAAITEPGYRSGLPAESAARVQAAAGLSARLRDEIGNGSVDIVPWEIDLVQAFGLNWDPRPVLGSYQAYTPYLDGIDAAHLSGPAAPEYVLLSPLSINNRYWFYDEPALMRALLEHYAALDWDANYLLLQRREAAVAGWHQISTIQGHLGQDLAVPQLPGQRVYAAIDVRYSLLGQILSLLFQPAELHVSVVYDGGNRSPGLRFVPAVARDGVLVSNFNPEMAATVQLFEGGNPHPVTSFRISADRAADYVSDFTVIFFAEPQA